MEARASCETQTDEEAWPFDTCVIVTAAGRENLVLRQLVRQAIPMVESPEDYPLRLREQLACSLRTAVEAAEEEACAQEAGEVSPYA